MALTMDTHSSAYCIFRYRFPGNDDDDDNDATVCSQREGSDRSERGDPWLPRTIDIVRGQIV